MMKMYWIWQKREATLEEFKRHVGPGWMEILKNLVSELESLGWDGHIFQVKEKFGGLRFYVGQPGEEIHEAIRKAERLSFETCEECGQPGTPRRGGWIKTLCDEHAKEKDPVDFRDRTLKCMEAE